MAWPTWTFHLKVITPLAMGGADARSAEWRAPSIKGMMRWWFRVAGGRREDEDRLFGSVRGEQAQASGVRVYVTTPAGRLQDCSLNLPAPYFGFSLKMNRRQCFSPGTSLTVTLTCAPWLSKTDQQMVLASFWLAVYLGCFGSRSRKGYGSLWPNRMPESDRGSMGLLFPLVPERVPIRDALQRVLGLFETGGRIREIRWCEKPWRSVQGEYRELRRNLGVPNKALLGYPFASGESGERENWPDRHASPLIIKPLNLQRGPCIITFLHVPREVQNQFGLDEQVLVRKVHRFLEDVESQSIWEHKGQGRPNGVVRE